MKFKVSLADSFAFRAASAAGAVTQAHVRAAQGAMRDLAQMTYNKAQELAAQRLSSTRQQYADALFFEQVGDNAWSIRLDGESAGHLEEGYPAFDMIKAGLARGPKSKMGKSGYRYVRIPFETEKGWATPTNRNNLTPVQRGQPMETTKGNLARDLKSLLREFGVDSSKYMGGDASGTTQGPVWSIRKGEGMRWNFRDILGNEQSRQVEGIHPNLNGLTGVQYKAGKQFKTAYMTWRTATENPAAKGKWKHPGFNGARVFPDLERWAAEQLGTMLREIFDGGSQG